MSHSDFPIDLWIIGTIGIDDIQTPFAKRENLLGGSAPYCSIAASFFTRPGVVGIIGTDFPTDFRSRWSKFGIDFEGVQIKEGPVFRWSGSYHANLVERDTLKTELGVSDHFHPRLPHRYQNSPFVLLGSVQPELQALALDQASSSQFILLDTIETWIQNWRLELIDVMKRVNLVTVNEEEARLLTGKEELNDCARDIFRIGPRYVVIKCGARGSILYNGNRSWNIPPYPISNVTDPTGAGDSFAGALIGKLAQNKTVSINSLLDALFYASAVASFCVEGFSIERFGSIQKEEIEARYRIVKEKYNSTTLSTQQSCANSSGRGAVKDIRSPVTGSSNTSLEA